MLRSGCRLWDGIDKHALFVPCRWFDDQDKVEAMRRAASACLPRLPGSQAPTGSKAAVGEPGHLGEAAPGFSGFQAHQLPDITRTADLLIVAVG